MIAKLDRLAGPVGPFQSFDDRLREKDAWPAEAESSLVDVLLGILLDPPSDAELASSSREDFEAELGEVMTRIGRRDPAGFLARVGPHLASPSARPTLIEVIGALGRTEGAKTLAPLVHDRRLSVDELVRLAGALGEIGTPPARRLLEELRAAHAGEAPDLDREIEVALKLVDDDEQ